MKASYSLSLIQTANSVTDLSDAQFQQLKTDIEAVFQPSSDPTDLPKELRLQAEKELNELPEKMKANIAELRQLIEGKVCPLV